MFPDITLSQISRVPTPTQRITSCSLGPCFCPKHLALTKPSKDSRGVGTCWTPRSSLDEKSHWPWQRPSWLHLGCSQGQWAPLHHSDSHIPPSSAGSPVLRHCGRGAWRVCLRLNERTGHQVETEAQRVSASEFQVCLFMSPKG